MSWAAKEMEGINLGDVRLENRAIKLIEQLSDKPTDSIPTACGDWQETKAAYRFFDNKKVTSESILAPHIKATIKRIKSEKIVLIPQDTTELNYRSQPEKKDVGPSHYDGDQALFLHPMIAVTPEKCPLGVLDDFSWYRTELHTKTRTKQEINTHLMHTSIEYKETYRWLLGYQKACKVAECCPYTQIICVGDRESDIFDIYHDEEQRGSNIRADWLVRGKVNRALIDENGERKSILLFEEMQNAPQVGTLKIIVPRRGNERKREAILGVKIKRVQLHPPTGRRGKLRLEPAYATVVATSEINPPKDSKPVEWTLLTSVYGDSLEDAKKFMTWYLARWQIEVFFKTLKSGCKIEANQLTNGSRFLPCITMYLVISWRIMFITHISRTSPELNCECCYSKIEWQTIYMVSKKRKPPKNPPSVKEITILVATWGGYLGRKGDGPPGPKTIWIGLRRLNDFIRGSETMKNLEDI